MNPRWLRPLCAGALALTSLLAHAQHSWIDDKGLRVFSDRPPPPGTPSERILKAPAGLESLALPAAAASAPEAGESEVPDWKKRDAEFRKRLALQEAAARDRRVRDSYEVGARKERKDGDERKLRCAAVRRNAEQVRRGSISTGKGQTTHLSFAAQIDVEQQMQRALRDCS